MRYCVTSEEVQWEMKDWKEEWKVLVEPIKYKQLEKDKESAKEKKPVEVVLLLCDRIGDILVFCCCTPPLFAL